MNDYYIKVINKTEKIYHMLADSKDEAIIDVENLCENEEDYSENGELIQISEVVEPYKIIPKYEIAFDME